MNYADYTKGEIDFSILERITEAEASQWFVARLAQFSEKGLPAHAMSLYVSRSVAKDEDFVSRINIHACGEVGSAHSVVHAERDLLGALGKLSPAAEAFKKKNEAARLLKEAEDLERMAAGKETASDA